MPLCLRDWDDSYVLFQNVPPLLGWLGTHLKRSSHRPSCKISLLYSTRFRDCDLSRFVKQNPLRERLVIVPPSNHFLVLFLYWNLCIRTRSDRTFFDVRDEIPQTRTRSTVPYGDCPKSVVVSFSSRSLFWPSFQSPDRSFSVRRET